MVYQLWELESRNCVAEFASRAEALQAIRELVSEHGSDATASLLLVAESDDGDLEEVATGAALAQLAGSAGWDRVRQPVPG